MYSLKNKKHYKPNQEKIYSKNQDILKEYFNGTGIDFMNQPIKSFKYNFTSNYAFHINDIEIKKENIMFDILHNKNIRNIFNDKKQFLSKYHGYHPKSFEKLPNKILELILNRIKKDNIVFTDPSTDKFCNSKLLDFYIYFPILREDLWQNKGLKDTHKLYHTNIKFLKIFDKNMSKFIKRILYDI